MQHALLLHAIWQSTWWLFHDAPGMTPGMKSNRNTNLKSRLHRHQAVWNFRSNVIVEQWMLHDRSSLRNGRVGLCESANGQEWALVCAIGGDGEEAVALGPNTVGGGVKVLVVIRDLGQLHRLAIHRLVPVVRLQAGGGPLVSNAGVVRGGDCLATDVCAV